jgi:maleylpyruvate isomerase
MKLYGYWRSTSSWRVRIALAYKSIAYTSIPINLVKAEQQDPDYRVMNPLAQVPILEWEERGKTKRLTQSMAIMEFLEERHPSPALLPKDPLARARVRSIAEMVNAGIQPVQNLKVAQYVNQQWGADRKAWCAHWIQLGCEALEAALQATAGTYCVGDELSLADVCVVPQLYTGLQSTWSNSRCCSVSRRHVTSLRHFRYRILIDKQMPSLNHKERIMRRYLFIICLLAVVSCQYQWGNPGTTTQQTAILMNTFVVSAEQRGELQQRWTAVADYMRRRPGFISTKLHQSVSDDQHWFNYAQWASIEHFKNAIDTDEFRRLTENFPGEGQPRLYHVVKTY